VAVDCPLRGLQEIAMILIVPSDEAAGCATTAGVTTAAAAPAATEFLTKSRRVTLSMRDLLCLKIYRILLPV
jgi:hypothetical protein